MLSKRKSINPKTFSKKKTRILSLRNFLILLFLIFVAFLFYSSFASIDAPVINLAHQQPSPSPDPLRPRNFLIMGYGGGGHQGGKLSDSIIIIHISPKENQIHLITIPRDLWVDLPLNTNNSLKSKINAALAIGSDDKKYPQKQDLYKGKFGGLNLSKKVVEDITQLPIDGVAIINFSTFVSTIDFLGGLEIEIPYSFTDEFYPIEGLENEPCDKTEEDIKALSATMSGYLLETQFGCRYESIAFKKGKQKLTGDDALKFVRSRHSGTDGGDFGRSTRQSAVITALQQKLLSPAILPKVPELIARITKSIETNLSISQVIELANLYKNMREAPIESISVTTKNVLKESRSSDGQYILVPINNDFEEISKFIKDSISPNISP